MTPSIFFALSLLVGVVLLGEGFSIVVLKKQVMPIPNRILYGLGVMMLGSEKSRQRFQNQLSIKELNTYASYALVFGSFIFLSSMIYLFTNIL